MVQRPAWVQTIRPIADILFPRVCLACQQVLVDTSLESLCSDCRNQLVPDSNRCQKCSAPVSRTTAIQPKTCRLCKDDWVFRKVFSMCTYRGTAAKVARKMKSEKNESLTLEIGDLLGHWLRETVDWQPYDFLIPVPQHWTRKIFARYNQADVLAECVHRVVGIPIRRDILQRSRWTEKQGTKTIEERAESVRNSFRCSVKGTRDLEEATILIVDDILTSGATANEAARALQRGGAARIDVVTFARGANSN